MGETYIEEMIARKASIVPTVLKVVFGAVCAGSIILGILGATLFYSVALMAGLGIYFVFYLTGVEYEYLYVDKSLSVNMAAAVLLALIFTVLCLFFPQIIMGIYTEEIQICNVAAQRLAEYKRQPHARF